MQRTTEQTLELPETASLKPLSQAVNGRAQNKSNPAALADAGTEVSDVLLRAEEEKAKLPDLVENALKIHQSLVLVNLRLALACCIIRLVEKDAFVDEILERILKDVGTRHGASALKITKAKSLCPYIAALLEWRRRSHPKLRHMAKLLMSFLRENPRYVLDITDLDLEKLAHDCGDLEGLLKNYGPKQDATKAELPLTSGSTLSSKSPSQEESVAQVAASPVPQPSVAKPVNATAVAAEQAPEPQRLMVPQNKQRAHPAHHVEDAESAQPTNDELLEKIFAIDKHLDRMKEEGVLIQADAQKALFSICLKAKQINAYFGIP